MPMAWARRIVTGTGSRKAGTGGVMLCCVVSCCLSCVGSWMGMVRREWRCRHMPSFLQRAAPGLSRVALGKHRIWRAAALLRDLHLRWELLHR